MITAKEAKDLQQQSNNYFDELMNEAEKKIKQRASDGYNNAIIQTCKQQGVHDRMKQDFVISGYTVSKENNLTSFEVEW